MKTLLTKSPAEAARIIRDGGIVAFPTETVYGLGADVFNEEAIAKIFVAKQRPADNPLIAHVSSADQINDLAEEITVNAAKLISEFFPGPLTVVVSKSTRVPLIASAGLDSVGVRMPRNEIAREFLAACGMPVVAPSANLSGRPSPTTWQAVHEDLDGRIDCILQGDPTEIGLESTVVDCRSEVPIVLRLGAVSLEQIQAVVPEAGMLTPKENETIRSPGLKHKHYAPKARVVIVETDNVIDGERPRAYIGITAPDFEFDVVRVIKNEAEYAHELFEFFRECDRQNVKTIFCESVKAVGIAAALMDRIKRASLAGK